MKNDMNISVKERMDALEKEISGEKLQQEMIRKAKQYSNDYKEYLKTAEITDSLKVGKDKDGGYLVPDEMEEGLVEAMRESSVIRKLSKVITTKGLYKVEELVKGPTGYWVEEGGPINFSDMEFYQVVLDAHKNGVMLGITEFSPIVIYCSLLSLNRSKRSGISYFNVSNTIFKSTFP